MPIDDRDKLEAQMSAYLDGELAGAERADLERRLALDPQARAMLESLRCTIQLVQGLPRRPAPDSLLDDLTARIEREHLLGEAPQRREIARPRRTLWPLLASAAVVVFAVGAGFWVMRDLVPERGGSPTLTFAPQDADRDREGGRALNGPSAAPAAEPKGQSDARLKKAEPAPIPAEANRSDLPGELQAASKHEGAAPARSETLKQALVEGDRPPAPPDESRISDPVGSVPQQTTEKPNEQAGFDKLGFVEAGSQQPRPEEPLQLNVSVETESERAILEEQLLAYFSANELEPIPPNAAVMGRLLEHKSAPSTVPAREVGGPDRPEEPLIVELPTHQVDGLVDQLAASPYGRRGIELQIGNEVIASGEAGVRRTLTAQRGRGQGLNATTRPDTALADAAPRDFAQSTRAPGPVTPGGAASSSMPAGVAKGDIGRAQPARSDGEDPKASIPSTQGYVEGSAAAASPATLPDDVVRLEINFRAWPTRGPQASQPASTRPATDQPVDLPIQPRSPHRIWRRRAP